MASVLSSLGGGVAGLTADILDLMLGLIGAVNQLLIKGITLLGSMLQGLLALYPSTGGPAVFAVWSTIRDISNIAFLAIMVLIAFGTIFNAVYRNPFHYSSSLFKLIIAAVLINFSLAFGQLIVGLGNSATNVVLGLLGPQDIGAQIATSVQLTSVVAGTFNPPLSAAAIAATSRTAAAIDPASLGQLTPAQLNMVQLWISGAKTGSAAPSLALTSLKSCLENKIYPTIEQCMTVANRYLINGVTQTVDTAAAAQNRTIASPAEVINFWSTYVSSNGTKNFTQPLTTRTDSDPSSRLGPLISSLLTFFMLLVLGLSFLTITIFLFARIPFLWMLLAVSAGAFLALAWPYGGSGLFTKWWKQVLGWSIFGPLYLFNIYIGLYILSKQGPLLASLGQGDNILGIPFAATFGSIMFFIVGFVIFTFGAAWCMKLSFGLSAGSEMIFKSSGWLVGTLTGADRIRTGVIARSQGAIAGVKGAYEERFTKPQRQREEIAREFYKAALGPSGMPGQIAEATRKRVDTERKHIEGPYKQQLELLTNNLNQARTDEMRALINGQIKRLKDSNTERLRRLSRSGNIDSQLAAGVMLMEDGKLTPNELRALGERYRSRGPAAMADFIKKRNAQLLKDAKERGYTKGNESAEIADYLSLLGDPKEAQKYLDEAGKGKNKVFAIEAGFSRKLVPKGREKPYETLGEAIEPQAKNFTPEDWANLAEVYKKSSKEILDESLKNTDKSINEVVQRYAQTLNNPERRAEILKAAKGNQDVLTQIQKDVREVRDRRDQLDSDIKRIKSGVGRGVELSEGGRVELRNLQDRFEEITRRPTKEQKSGEKKPEEKKEEAKAEEPKKEEKKP